MEFKNFENKLIIEKITNYCIENNISTQKINALTAKIKFGKLNEADSWTDWAGEKIGTGAGRYRKSIRVVQDNLQKAMDYLKAVDADLGPGNNNIFTKNKVSLDGAKKNALQNAVSQLKGAIDQYSPIVKNSLQAIGGQITGASNYEDEQSFDFDAMFPELKTNGTLETAFKNAYSSSGRLPNDKKADLNRILLQSRQNILKTFKVLDASKHGEFIQKIKSTVAKVITDFNDPTKVADGYALLNTIVGGINPTSNPTPTKLPLTDGTTRALISNPKLNMVYTKDLITNHLNDVKKLFEKIYDGNSTNVPKMRILFDKAIANVPESLASHTPAVTTADPDVSAKIIDQIESLFN